MVEDDSTEETFKFEFPTCTTNEKSSLEIPLKIPFNGSVKELTHRIMSSFKLPCYVEQDLLKSLGTFVKERSLSFHDKRSEKLVERAQSGELDVEEIIKNLEKAYKLKTAEYAEPMGTTDEELFAAAYHRLVHSPALEPILQAEHEYGNDVTKVIQMRDSDNQQLTKKLIFR